MVGFRQIGDPARTVIAELELRAAAHNRAAKIVGSLGVRLPVVAGQGWRCQTIVEKMAAPSGETSAASEGQRRREYTERLSYGGRMAPILRLIDGKGLRRVNRYNGFPRPARRNPLTLIQGGRHAALLRNTDAPMMFENSIIVPL